MLAQIISRSSTAVLAVEDRETDVGKVLNDR